MNSIFACSNYAGIANADTVFHWPASTSYRSHDLPDAVRTLNAYTYVEPMPEAKHFHKIKKIKKKLLLLCLLGGAGGGRNARSVASGEGKFIFPVIQHTDVNVGGNGYDQDSALDDDEDEDGAHGGATPFNCGQVLNSAPSHPLLAGALGGLGNVIGGGGSSSSSPSYEVNENRVRRIVNRNLARPFYRSMRRIYRYF